MAPETHLYYPAAISKKSSGLIPNSFQKHWQPQVKMLENPVFLTHKTFMDENDFED